MTKLNNLDSAVSDTSDMAASLARREQAIANIPAPNYMAEYGSTLLANGYNILPIIPNQKIPGRYTNGTWFPMSDWQRYCERQPTEAEISLWAIWPQCGIGVACGQIIGIDIDVLDATVAMELENLARAMLGDTPVLRIGRAPKRALFYRSETPFAGRKLHPLEVIGVGGQMVVAGIHPDTGNPYSWPTESLIELDIDKLPTITEAQAMAWLSEAFKRVPDELKPKRFNGDAVPSESRFSSDPRGTYAAVKSALQYIPNDDLDGSSWVAMLNAIKASLAEEGRNLWLDWSKSSAKSGASGKFDTAERRWKNAKPRDIGAGSIYWQAEQRGWVPEADLVLNGDRADQAALPSPAAAFVNAVNGKAKPVAQSTELFPSELLSVGGIIGDLVELFTASAVSPQPVLALGAAVSLVGTMAGQKYAGRRNLRTNVYAIGIADSGGGKDYARTVIKSALFAAGLEKYLGGEEIASGQALLTSLEKHPCRIFLLDEMGKFIQSVTGPRAPAYRVQIWTTLTKLYTSSSSIYIGTEYANQDERPRVNIKEPCLSVYGVTVPGRFWSALGSGDLLDGSIARFLLFLTDDDYPDEADDWQAGPIPDHIISGLQALDTGYVSGEPPGNLSGVFPAAYSVPYAPEAIEAERAIMKERLTWLRAKKGTDETAIVARFGENVGKVALIRAISDNPANPVVTAENFAWATKLVRHCVAVLLREAGRHVADSPVAATENRILEFVRKNSGQATAEEIGQAVRMKARDRQEILNDLVSRYCLLLEVRDTGGKRKVSTYRLPSLC